MTIYNGALRLLGQPKLSALTDAVENRRLLDGAFDENARDHCLQQGNWNFAIRTAKVSYDSSISPSFGFRRGYSKPSDWLKTVELASDEYFYSPMTHAEFVDEQSKWFADIDDIYVRYISNNTSYGYDLSLWPQSFVRYVEAYLALQIMPFLVQDTNRVIAFSKAVDKLLNDARSKDALNEGAKFQPAGNWVRARRGTGGSRGDLGSRGSLTG